MVFAQITTINELMEKIGTSAVSSGVGAVTA